MKNVILLGCVLVLVASCSAPKPIFNVQQQKYVAPVIVQFQNQSENADSYLWDFGDGATSEEANPSHRYIASGNYTVTLKAMKEGKGKETEQTVQIAAPEKCLVELSTEYGNMLIELYDDTPEHRDNFSKLAEEGYYKDLLFHRVIDGFMIQGGDPASRDARPGQRLGGGGPDYTIPAEISSDRIHLKGALAAARRGDQINPEKRSSGSQFYIVDGKDVVEQMLSQIETRNGITYSPDQRKAYLEQGGTPFLDGEYTVFGRVIDGLEVIDKLAEVKTDRSDRPITDIKMNIILIK